jgi:Uma2 family endonuclease
MAVPQPDKKHWSRQEIINTPDGPERYEVIEGELYLTPSPAAPHQDIVTGLATELRVYARDHDAGKVLVAPLDVAIDEHQSVQPDIIFVSRERVDIIKDCIEGAPDLVVEVCSPSSQGRDRVVKSRVYARFGIPNYWIVDHSSRTIEAFQLTGELYTLVATAIDDETFEPSLFPGLKIDLATIWP